MMFQYCQSSRSFLLRIVIVAAAIFACALGLLPSTPSAQGEPSACFADWSEAGPVARDQGLLPVSDALRLVARHTEGKVIRIKLCREGSRYSYHVTLARHDGRIARVLVDADEGTVRPLAR